MWSEKLQILMGIGAAVLNVCDGKNPPPYVMTTFKNRPCFSSLGMIIFSRRLLTTETRMII